MNINVNLLRKHPFSSIFSAGDGEVSEPVNIFSTNSSWVEFAARRIKAGWNVSLYYNTIQYSMIAKQDGMPR